MVARGGRLMPVVRGFLGDGPVRRLPIGGSGLGGVARPVLHHPPLASLRGRVFPSSPQLCG